MKLRELWLMNVCYSKNKRSCGCNGVYCNKEQAVDAACTHYRFFYNLHDEERLAKFRKRLEANEVSYIKEHKYTIWSVPFIDTDWTEENTDNGEEK